MRNKGKMQEVETKIMEVFGKENIIETKNEDGFKILEFSNGFKLAISEKTHSVERYRGLNLNCVICDDLEEPLKPFAHAF